MTEFIFFMTRGLIAFVLFVPALALTIAIWVMGGWTKGWDDMPNPLYILLDWAFDL